MSSVDGVPVEDAQVGLDLMPTDGNPEYKVDTDVFGFFTLTNLTAGQYGLSVITKQYLPYSTNLTIASGVATNKVIKLTPIDGKVVFDIFFSVACLATAAPLEGSTIQIEYWQPGSNLNGGPDAISTLTADGDGLTTASKVEDGFYRFTISRPGWETLVYQPPNNGDFVVVGDKVRIIRSAIASVLLRPVQTNLKVIVTGYDPVQDKADQPLKGIVIKLTGVSFANPPVTLVPTISVLSLADGSFTFKNLPPIQWQIQVGHLGYAAAQALATPDATANFADVKIPLVLDATKVKVILSSIYQTNSAVSGANVHLEGIRNSNSEGITRDLPTTADTNNTAFALFENLLPGRYYIRVKHQATVSGLPNKSGPLPGPDSFHVDFFQRESFAEVATDTTEDLPLTLDPIPARIQGRISAEDEQARVEEDPFEPHQNRVWRRIAQDGVTFLEHKVINLLNNSSNSFAVDTDSSGHFTILIPPGIFGIKIPTMTDYSGHNIEFGDLTANVAAQEGPWPYPDVWPYATFEDQHHGAGLRFDSSHEYQVDLFVHRHFINLVGVVQTKGEPFLDLVLSMKPDGTAVQTIPYNHLADVGATVTATGTASYSTKVIDGGYYNLYIIKNMQPGSYNLTLDSSEYTTPPVPVTIAPWQAPGILPAIAPYSPGYYFPGINQYDQAFTIKPEWAAKGAIAVDEYDWQTPKDLPPLYVFEGTRAPGYFRASNLPGRLFQYQSFVGSVPAPSYVIWQNFFSYGWFTSASSGSQTFTAYLGGPSSNTDPNNAPSDVSSFTMDLHAFSIADPNMEIPGVTVLFQNPNKSRVAGGSVPYDDNPNPVGITNVPNWFYDSSSVKLENAALRIVRVNVFLKRAMVVSGVVTNVHGAVPTASVVVRNRYGNPLAQSVTSADGTFNFPLLEPQTIYLDVNRRGFIAQRKRFEPPSPVDPDIKGATLTLLDVPEPTIDTFTMNRFGLFLPGVLKSGDANGVTPDEARDKLTVTWKATARGTNYSYTLDGTVQADETQGPNETFDVVDQVSEVWIVDRRAFKDVFVNNPNQTSYDPVNPPAPHTYIRVMEWLADINAAQKTGQPYYVIHQQVHRGQIGPGNNFQGKFNLWEMPSGVFNPRLIAITENGGVAVMDYQLPTTAPGPSTPTYIALQGMNMPEWVAGLTELIAHGAAAGKFTGDVHATYGSGFMKIGTASPVAEAHISLDPLNKGPDDDANLLYKYVLGVELPLGEEGSGEGAVSFGPSLMGYKVTGLTVEFEVTGKDRKAALALVQGGGKAPELEERDKDFKPALTRPLPTGTVHFEPIEFKESAKIGASQILDADWLGNNVLSGFTFILEAQGTADIKADADLDFVVHKLPYAGPVLAGLKKLGLRVGLDALFETTLGAKLTYEHVTTYPRVSVGTQSAADQGQRWDFLGSPTNSTKLELNIIVRVAAGLRITAKAASDASGSGPKVEGSGLIQVGAPKGSNNPEGMYFQIDPVHWAPFFQKISGSLSLIARVGVNLWTIQISKQWQYDVAKWDIDYTVPAPPTAPQTKKPRLQAASTDGEPYMQLTPIFLTYTIFNPASAPPYQFVGKNGNLVNNFYRPGSMSVSRGTNPLFTFTAIDPNTGESTLMVSSQGAGQWKQPVKVATAGGLLSIASVELPAGGWMVAWSEIAISDLGNPYPSTTLKYSVSSTDGNTWSPPTTLASDAAAMFNLNIARAGTKVLLSYLSTTEGPLGDNQSLYTTVWNGTQWSAPQSLLPAQTIRTTDLAGDPNGTAVLVVTTGDDQLLTFDWNGTAWSAARPIDNTAAGAVSVAFGVGDVSAVAWQSATGAVLFASRPAGAANWNATLTVITNLTTTELQMVPLTVAEQTSYLVAWIGSGDTNSIFYAIVDAQGHYQLPPTEATVGSAGSYAKLHLRALPGAPRAALVAQYNTGTNSGLIEIVIGLPSPGDCNGNGIPDDVEIANGLVQDCNHNGIPDSCEIASGAVQDKNHNGIPDDCEAPIPDDCNRNGVSDIYELSLGIGDLDGNGILDACETGVMTKNVSLTGTKRTHFYRATGIKIKTQAADSLGLEYGGTLEEADDLSGPWTAVP